MFESLRQFGKCDAADDKKCVFARHRNVNMFRFGGGSSDDDKRLIHVVRANNCSLVWTDVWKWQSDSECECAIRNLPIENRLFQSILCRNQECIFLQRPMSRSNRWQNLKISWKLHWLWRYSHNVPNWIIQNSKFEIAIKRLPRSRCL